MDAPTAIPVVVLVVAVLLGGLAVAIGRGRPPKAVRMAEDAEAKRAAIKEDIRRLVVVYRTKGIDDAEYEADKARLEEALHALDVAAAPRIVPASVDWTWPAPQLNDTLRAILAEVQMGPDMLPASAEWHAPEWRAE